MTRSVENGAVAYVPDRFEPSAVDTARFGRPIGRLSLSGDTGVDPADVVKRFAASELDILVLRYPAELLRWHAALASHDVAAIHADNLIYFTGAPAPLPSGSAEPALISGIELGRSSVDAVTRAVFADYPNHVAANPLLDASQVVAGYEEWMRDHLDSESQQVLVLLVNEEPAGIAAVSLDAAMVVDLAGVVPKYRRRGHYETLLRALSAQAFADGQTAVTISTQSHNIAAMRTWVKLGWRPELTLETVHLVRRSLLEGSTT